MEMTLRGAVLQKYPSATAFGKAMGWTRYKASNIINGRVQPTANEMIAIAKNIGAEDAQTFMSLFFPSLTTK